MENQLEIFAQNAETFIGADDLKKKLAEGKKLRVKLGVDPTRPTSHSATWLYLIRCGSSRTWATKRSL